MSGFELRELPQQAGALSTFRQSSPQLKKIARNVLLTRRTKKIKEDVRMTFLKI
jgi:hypothetical protein